MPDIAPLLVAVLSAIAVALIAIGFMGRRDRLLPRCRRCGADARSFAWHQPPTCACGALLGRPGAVRVAWQVRWRVVITGVVVAALALGLGVKTARVHSEALGWRGSMPLWMFIRTIDWDGDSFRSHRLNDSRIDHGLSRDDARRWLDHMLDRDGVRAADGFSMQRLVETAAPEGELGRRYVAQAFQLIDVIAKATPDGTELRFESTQYGHLPPFFVRIDAVTIDGKDREHRVLSSNDQPIERRWLSISEAPRLVIAGESIDAGRIAVRGTAAYCGQIDNFLKADPLFAANDDPMQWKLPVAMGTFELKSIAAQRRTPGSMSRANWMPPPRFRSFFGPEAAQPAPFAIAASRVSGAASAGLLAGVAFVVGLVVAQLTFRRRPSLAPPACARCGATVRGADEAVPGRCTECGGALQGTNAVRWTQANGRIPFARVVAAATAVIAFATAAWFSPRLANEIEYAIQKRYETPECYGEWAAQQYLEITPAVYNAWWTELGSGQFSMLRHASNSIAEPTREIALRTIAKRWRDAERSLAKRRPDDCERALAAWAGAVAHAIMDFRAEELRPTLDEILAAQGGAHITIPRCVRVGEPIRIGRRYSDLAAEVAVRALNENGAPAPWQPTRGFALPAPTKPGEVDCAVEWALAWQKPNELSGRMTLDEMTTRIAGFSVGGVVRQRVLVLPADATSMSDPRADPFGPGDWMILVIRELGERDAVWINANLDNKGAAAFGDIELDLRGPNSSGPPRTLTLHRDQYPSWRALVATPVPLPEEIVARFVPGDAPSSSSNPPVLRWSGTSTVRFRRAYRSNLVFGEIYQRVDDRATD